MEILILILVILGTAWVSYCLFCVTEEIFELRQELWEFKEDLNKDIEYLESLIIKKNLE